MIHRPYSSPRATLLALSAPSLVLLAGCASVLGADFDRAPASDDAGAGGDGDPVAALADGSGGKDGNDAATGPCVPDDTADCAGKCGDLKGRCGSVIACGGCTGGQSCGGGGPNTCGNGTCTPSCTGKACGDSDNCSGVCASGKCDNGLTCVSGACACADAAHACVPAAPAGWGGPFALYDGAAGTAPPPCAAPFGATAYDGKAGLAYGAATCSACTCGTPTGATCSKPVFDMFSDLGCVTKCGTITPGGTGIGTTCGSRSFKPTADSVVTGGACTAIGGGQQVLPYSWTTVARGCAPQTVVNGCPGGGVCMPKPSAPFATGYCVYDSGDQSCPASFPVKHLYYQDAVDTRTCTACGCGAPTGGANACTWRAWFYASGCSGGGYPTDGPTGGRCDGFNSTVTCMDNFITGPTGTLSCAITGGKPSGGVTPSQPTTVCCAP